MIATKEEKEMIDRMGNSYRDLGNKFQNQAETMMELIGFLNNIVLELKEKDPAMALRIMNKGTDILTRQQKGIMEAEPEPEPEPEEDKEGGKETTT